MNKTSFSIIGYFSEQKPMASIVQLYLKGKEKDRCRPWVVEGEEEEGRWKVLSPFVLLIGTTILPS
jgi:hypothetical protein